MAEQFFLVHFGKQQQDEALLIEAISTFIVS